MRVSWPIFKTHLAKGLLPQIIKDTDSEYGLVAFDGPMILECTINKRNDDGGVPASFTEFDTSYKSKCNIPLYLNRNSPFDSKMVGDKRLFRHVFGLFSNEIPPGDTGVIDFVVPFVTCKFNKLCLVNSAFRDTCDFKVYDTPQGLVQLAAGVPPGMVVPSKLLSLFGHTVSVPSAPYFVDESTYDADLIKDLKLSLSYTNNGSEARTIGVNFIIHELR